MSHKTHCCVIHGCKYCDDDCPVENNKIPQTYPCEDCERCSISELQIIEDQGYFWGIGRSPNYGYYCQVYSKDICPKVPCKEKIHRGIFIMKSAPDIHSAIRDCLFSFYEKLRYDNTPNSKI